MEVFSFPRRLCEVVTGMRYVSAWEMGIDTEKPEFAKKP